MKEIQPLPEDKTLTGLELAAIAITIEKLEQENARLREEIRQLNLKYEFSPGEIQAALQDAYEDMLKTKVESQVELIDELRLCLQASVNENKRLLEANARHMRAVCLANERESKLREALAFYADADTYKTKWSTQNEEGTASQLRSTSPIREDLGFKASQALGLTI